MSAFPQLGYGYKSNTSHIATETPPTEEAIMWWKHCLTTDERVELIKKHHPNCERGSGMLLFGLHVSYTNNPQKLYDEWVKENR